MDLRGQDALPKANGKDYFRARRTSMLTKETILALMRSRTLANDDDFEKDGAHKSKEKKIQVETLGKVKPSVTTQKKSNVEPPKRAHDGAKEGEYEGQQKSNENPAEHVLKPRKLDLEVEVEVGVEVEVEFEVKEDEEG